MAHFAAARRAASQLLLADAAPHASVTPTLSVASQHAFLSAIAQNRAAATSLLLTAAATPSLGVASQHAFLSATAQNRAAATSLLLADADATITTPRSSVAPSISTASQRAFRSATADNRADATSLLLTGAYSVRSAGNVILGRRALFPARLSHGTAISPAALHRLAPRCFATGSTTSEPLTPELQSVLKRMDDAFAKRHDDFLKEMKKFEIDIMEKYATEKLSSSETALTAGKVAWRVSTAVLAFGVTTLIAVLQTVKDGWKVDFHREVKHLLKEMMASMKADILAQIPKLVRTELKVIEAEKAASNK